MSAVGLRIRAVVAAVIAVGVLIAVTVVNATNRAQGVEVIVRSELVDPRDLFFGNYATLTYPQPIRRLSDLRGGRAVLSEINDGEGPGTRFTRDLSVAGTRYEAVVAVAFARGADGFDEAVAVAFPDQVDRLPAGRYVLAPLRVDVWPGYDVEDGIIDLQLPRRYYADPETALALERVLRRSNETGVILRYPREGGAPLIAGLVIGEERFDDTLTGPRRTLRKALVEDNTE